MANLWHQAEIGAITYGIVRVVIVALSKLLGALIFYTASKLGEDAAVDYIRHKLRWKQ